MRGPPSKAASTGVEQGQAGPKPPLPPGHVFPSGPSCNWSAGRANWQCSISQSTASCGGCDLVAVRVDDGAPQRVRGHRATIRHRGKQSAVRFNAVALFHNLDTSSHIGDQCNPIRRILTAEEPHGFVWPRGPLVVLGLAWFITGISLSAYMVRDDRYWGIWSYRLTNHREAWRVLHQAPALMARHRFAFGRHLLSDLSRLYLRCREE